MKHVENGSDISKYDKMPDMDSAIAKYRSCNTEENDRYSLGESN